MSKIKKIKKNEEMLEFFFFFCFGYLCQSEWWEAIVAIQLKCHIWQLSFRFVCLEKIENSFDLVPSMSFEKNYHLKIPKEYLQIQILFRKTWGKLSHLYVHFCFLTIYNFHHFGQKSKPIFFFFYFYFWNKIFFLEWEFYFGERVVCGLFFIIIFLFYYFLPLKSCHLQLKS